LEAAVATKPAKASDPLDVNARLYRQIARLLDQLEDADAREEMTIPQRISALIAVARIQKIFLDLRKGEFTVGAGSEVRKYAAAFAAPNATGRGAGKPGAVVKLDSSSGDDDDSWGDHGWGDGGDAA
jgi:hypothetical protein